MNKLRWSEVLLRFRPEVGIEKVIVSAKDEKLYNN